MVAQIGDREVDPEQVRIVTCGRHFESDEAKLESLGFQSKYHVIAVFSTQRKSTVTASQRSMRSVESPKVTEAKYFDEPESKSTSLHDEDLGDSKTPVQEIHIEETEVHIAIKNGKLKAASQIIKGLSKDELKRVVGTQNAEGMTPLMYAATDGNSKIFNALYEHMTEEQLILKSNNGMTVMHLATKSGNSQFLKR